MRRSLAACSTGLGARRRALLILVVLGLLDWLPPSAVAQTVGRTVELSAGGLTIGGPGAFQGDPGDERVVWTTSDAEPENVCATVVNSGSSSVRVELDTNPGGAVLFSIGAGRTATVCRNATYRVTLVCFTDGSSCRYLWRVDRKN